ncbi:GDSL-type esterase/lipase family protein [Corynebacterium anserum]|uniref:Esterase n=1 Tax=Corynebacterium anserum TaxID=2684406 RepID=A0A7G7YMI1_9CORY|nr:GDSL-type esterase/lipase family protein [Corynebacterium anserum]MBC2681070.1 esterase [Corynebacterium anserum]QNH95701.1 esterase [Corynebacterium anserum]
MAKFSAKVRTAAIAAVAALSLGTGAGVAAAQQFEIPGFGPITFPSQGGGNKELVTFGDSFTANAGKGGPRGLQPGHNALTANCATDMENWPKTAAKDLNVSLGDWSCNGTGGLPALQLMAYVEAAIAQGDLGPGTKDVVMMYGGMDAIQWVQTGQTMAPELKVDFHAFNDTMRVVGDRIREVAPNARIFMTSYSEYATNDQLCLVNLPGNVTNPIPAPGATRIQEAFRDNLRNTAAANNFQFIDVYQQSIGHGTCAPEGPDRWVAGFVDPNMGPMTNHPTVAGAKATGHIIARGLR